MSELICACEPMDHFISSKVFFLHKKCRGKRIRVLWFKNLTATKLLRPGMVLATVFPGCPAAAFPPIVVLEIQSSLMTIPNESAMLSPLIEIGSF